MDVVLIAHMRSLSIPDSSFDIPSNCKSDCFFLLVIWILDGTSSAKPVLSPGNFSCHHDPPLASLHMPNQCIMIRCYSGSLIAYCLVPHIEDGQIVENTVGL